ncbi:MAG TPA: FtsQ-type POTRA domain-containing protein [Chloroflexota bacterium]|nr:FtsQ-type POTRA domain-containing protein [Chloroflexota bacterium]
MFDEPDEDVYDDEDDGFDERLAARVLPRLLYLILSLAVLGGAAYVQNSPTFRIQHVKVVGAHFLAPDAVVGAAQIQGQSPFAIASGSVTNRVLALGVPARVTVFYQLPDTAVISISEKQPAYIWKVDPTLYLVAEDGTILGTTPSPTLPTVVVDQDHQPVAVGQKIDPTIFPQAQAVLQVLPRLISPAPTYLLHSRAEGLIIPTGVVPEVVLGDGDSLDAKLTVLRPVLQAALAARPVPRYVDLRVPSHPYFR